MNKGRDTLEALVDDWPMMPTSMHELELGAFGVFDRKPALDLPK